MAKLLEFMAQMTFLSIANSLATYSVAQLFRYRSESDFYDNGVTVYGETNYWELSNIIP